MPSCSYQLSKQSYTELLLELGSVMPRPSRQIAMVLAVYRPAQLPHDLLHADFITWTCCSHGVPQS